MGHHEDDTEGLGVPRYYKLSFPTFDGREDPLGWLHRCEHFFRAQRTGEVGKVGLASFHMTGAAQQWYYMLERDEGMPTWPHFKALSQQCFGPAMGVNHLADLARIPFWSSVDEYIESFQTRLAHAGYMTPEQRTHLFTGGLPDHIRIDVELQAPQELQRAMALARAYERRATTTTPAGHHRTPRPQPRPLPLPAPPTSAPPVLPTPATTTSSVPPRAFRRLTPTEMAERRRQGLCYNCDDPFVRGHKCPRLFFLEVADPEEDVPNLLDNPLPVTDAEPFISLNAITGIRGEDTMQVCITIGTQEFTALLDSGSTTNFINHAAGRVARLLFQSGDGAYVRMDNGYRVDCSGLARDVAIRIGQEEFIVHCFSIL
jgi:hypothetical protein